jgi:hypothetical protein
MALRTKVLESLMILPGSTRNDLARRHEVTWHAVAYHIDALIDQGVVREVRHGARRHLFHVASAPPPSVAVIQPSVPAILRALSSSPLRIVDIGRRIGKGRKQVAAALVRLRIEQLVELCSDGRHRLTDAGRRCINLIPSTPEAST